MKTAGQILKEKRLKKNLGLKRVAKATKIRPIYLEALEKDEYQRLPALTSARGFIKNYAEFLGLNSEELLAIFRRDFDEKKTKTGSSSGLITKTKFAWTPRLTTLVAIGIFVLLFLGYLVWQYFSLISAPYY